MLRPCPQVSTIEQKRHGLSVDNQIDALQKYCEENGYICAGIYNDAGFSASKSYKTRPALLQMIEDCKKGKIDLVAFTKLDRFFRNVPDYYACVEQMAGIPWVSIWEDYETETSAGKFKVNIMLSVAQAESDRTSERIRAVKQFQREQGKYVGGVAPMGYKVEHSELVIDEDQRETVEMIFKTYLQTHSVMKVLELLRDKGCSRSRHGIYNMLINPTYKGDAFGYKCEPYITEAEHNEILKELGTKYYKKHDDTKIPYMFSGKIICAECGKPMAGSFSRRIRGGNEKLYKYYRCTGWQNRLCTNSKNISEMKLEKMVIDQIEPAFEAYQIRAKTAQKEVKSCKARISTLEGKLKRIGERFEDGDISREEYREKRDVIKMEISELNTKIVPIQKELPKKWLSIYEQLDVEHKKYFWGKIIDKIEYSGEEIKVNI